MQMIFNPIDPIKMTILVFYYSPDVSIKLVDVLLLNGRQAVLGSENKVIQKLAVT